MTKLRIIFKTPFEPFEYFVHEGKITHVNDIAFQKFYHNFFLFRRKLIIAVSSYDTHSYEIITDYLK